MVRTRKKDYNAEVMQQKHRQKALPTRAETEDEAISGAAGTAAKQKGAPKADHIGKRNRRRVVFTRFRKLPCELRLMIWEAAATPRLVAVIPRPCPKDSDTASNREISIIRGIPALFAVNKESRHVALRHYTWRFTLDIKICCGMLWAPNVEHRRAHVVMSPDDTLGLFPCQQGREDTVWISKFDVKASNDKRSPWRVHESTDAPNQGFKKVAILGDAVKANLHIVRALNVTLWNLESILHAQSADIRTAVSPHTKNTIFVESGKIATNSLDLPQRKYRPLLDWDRQSPDILAYKLADSEDGTKDWKVFLHMLSGPPSPLLRRDLLVAPRSRLRHASPDEPFDLVLPPISLTSARRRT